MKFIIILLLLVSLLPAKTLYVNISTGSDATTYANNTSVTPWATIARSMWGSTNRASLVVGEAAQAGDTVIVAPGNYTTAGLTNCNTANRWSPVLISANSGTAVNPIVYMAQYSAAHNTTNESIIEMNTGANYSTGEPAIGSTTNKDYIEYNGFKIIETTSNRQDCGVIIVHDCDNVKVINCEIIGIYASYQNNHAGIRIEGATNATIRNNIIHEVLGAYGDHSNAILLYHNNDILIEHNNMYNCGTGVHIKGSETWWLMHDITVRFNYIYDLGEGVWLMGADGDVITADVYQNLFVNCTKAVTFYGAQGGSGDLSYGPQPDSCRVVNNTADNCTYSMSFKSPVVWGQGNKVRNNIFNDSETLQYWSDTGTLSSLYYSTGRILFDYNFIDDYAAWGLGEAGSVSLATWQGATYGQDVNSTIGTDPGFVADNSNYRLDTGSAAKGIVTDILDLDGDASYVDLINAGCYVNATDTMGVLSGSFEEPPEPAGDIEVQLHFIQAHD